MFSPIAFSEVFQAHGVPIFIGAFAVEKRGVVPAGVARIIRLIMNCVTNADLRSLVFYLKTLLGAAAGATLLLGKVAT